MDLTNKDVRAVLGARMKELRKQHGATQQQAADALGVAQNTYAQMESGVVRFRRRDLVTLAVLYGMPLKKAFPDFFAMRVAA